MRSVPVSRVRSRALVGSACGALLCGCASSVSTNSVVGSDTMQELTAESALVQRVLISVPFRTTVYNGETGKLVVRGEDNLIRLIDVSEVSAGQWEIRAPMGLHFVQHADVELEIPYRDMVEIGIDGHAVNFADNPAEAWAGA